MNDSRDRPKVNLPGVASRAEAGCPFCARLSNAGEVIEEVPLCFSFFDTTPLTPGHALVVPKRHVSDFLALSRAELDAILDMAVSLRSAFEDRFHPDAYNLGVNIGDAAGQTIGHAHLHVIPRYVGDVRDPRGGIRWIIPERARYWD